MSDTLIRNARWPNASGDGWSHGDVLIRDGKIASAGKPSATPLTNVTTYDANGTRLTLGLIDIHTHGIGPHLYERSVDDLFAGTQMLGQFGTTCILPTLYRALNQTSLIHLEALANAIDQIENVVIPGFHLEGPFLALPGAGAETVSGDVNLLDELIAAMNGRIKVMSISPDTPNILPVIERLVEHNIIPFITHTRADVEQTCRAIHAGACHATHFYDVFHVPGRADAGVRPVGAVEAILANPQVTVDFIADGVHVHPIAIQAAIAAKGYKGVLLISDSNIGAGLPAGRYDTPWGFPIRVAPGEAARIDLPDDPRDGGLAGSAITMCEAVRNMHEWLDDPLEKIIAMATTNPARLLGLENKQKITPGADADLVLWDDTLKPKATWVGGRVVFER